MEPFPLKELRIKTDAALVSRHMLMAPPTRTSACRAAQQDQPMWRGHGNFLALTCDNAVLFPGTQQAADGVQGGACHVGYVLPGDWKVDLDPVLDFAAHLGDQPQQGASDALLDLLGGLSTITACMSFNRAPTVA